MKKELLFSTCLLMGCITGGVKAKDLPLPMTIASSSNMPVTSQDDETSENDDSQNEEEGTKTITVTNPGELATFANSSSLTDEYTSATRINVVGENVTLNDDDLAAVEKFTAIKTLDLSQVKVESVDAYKNIKTPTANYQITKINLIIPCAEDAKNEDGSIKYTDQAAYLKDLGEKVSSSWDSNIQTICDFYINEAGNRTCHAFVKSSNGWNIDDIVKGADNLDIVSNDGNLGNSLGKLLVSLNNVNVTRLVLANVPNYGGTFDFTPFTNPYVHCIVLPTKASNDMTQPIQLGEGAAAKVFQALKTIQTWTTDGKTVDKDFYYVYCAEPGALAKIENNHYYQNDISNAWSERFYGNVNEEDFKYLTKVKNNRFNMANLKHVDADGNVIDLRNAIATINNPYIEYLALPDGVREAADPTFKNLFEGEEACPNLKAVGFMSKVTIGEGDDATTKNTISIASNERGGIYELLDMLGTTRTEAANKYQFSGLAYAKDLAVGQIYVDENGHRTVKPTGTIYGEYEGDRTGTLSTGLISIKNASEFDFSNIRLWDEGEEISDEEKAAAQNDLLFTAMGYNKGMTVLKLPRDKSVYRLPNSCIANFQNIKTLCIPSNYTEIGSAAFLNDNSLQLIYTTAVKDGVEGYLVGGEFQTEEPTADNTTQHTCQLPTNLTRIEKHAFGNCEMYTDVYISLNEKGEVPYCEKDAFSSGTLQGWGGFNGKHPITRENYKNSSDDKKMFAILHFPSGLPKAKAELFTDLNRDYSLADEKGTTDGNGNVLIWPTHTEWIRSFHQANSGYNWFDWTLFDDMGNLLGGTGDGITSREVLLKADGSLSDNAKKYGLTDIYGDKAKYNTFAPRNPNYTEGSSESILEEHNTWIGWHQFVLTAAFDYVNPTENKWHAYTTDDNWWTTCLPFDMTKAEIIKTWGEGTKLCTLTGVKRDKTNNTITLEFGEDLVAKATSDNEKVLYFRRPYMVKPGQMEKLKDENGDYTGPVFTLTDEQNATLEKAAGLVQSEIGSHPRPKDSAEGDQCCVTVTAKDENGNEIEGYEYTFLGSYTKYYVPTYAYFLGWDVNKVNYFYQTEKPIIMNWNPYTCTIGHYSPSEVTWSQTVGATSRWSYTCVPNDTGSSNPDLMPGTSETPQGAKGMKLYFGADNTTSIDQISADGGIQTIPVADVYNLSGQLVRKKGTLEGLSKGIYIIGGKKYIVK